MRKGTAATLQRYVSNDRQQRVGHGERCAHRRLEVCKTRMEASAAAAASAVAAARLQGSPAVHAELPASILHHVVSSVIIVQSVLAPL